ncbi:ZIP-like iron-zinc transporter [Dichomitus squalens LYAD-421 SS1]|uniref:ZIP-like iron-zinc transporter n=1 Tax=Dichomitus squalens (strain LYAD-421) TaxID=732165 RepID=R7STX7_DICSQ|nr:ZIP-like iron-zinc transporter [Dichomitus squalens LYAD-421 SS1]EJF59373.1 ZIP-like iron-zinc transporter [Dichomitus squalens LYAD-421 SS1]
MSDSADCTFTGNANTKTGLRIASIFIIMTTSMSGALFPVLARRNKYLRANIPQPVFETAKYFGSGVIIATALIHLLGPAIEELGSPCLDPAWQDYPYPLGICLVSIFGIFITELVAFRWGTSRLARLGIVHDAHGHGLASHAAHGPETDHEQQHELESGRRAQHQDTPNTLGDSATAQIIGIAILEFGVLLHSVLIGLTLAVDQQFTVLFVVLIFHQTFEGLGVGSRLAFMRLPAKYDYVPVVGGLLYGITTPIGIAVGLGVRTTYNPNSNTANIVSGILDSFSSGILLYTGLVELIAHEFLFNADMLHASNGKLAYALGCMIAGAGIMALLGRWA